MPNTYSLHVDFQFLHAFFFPFSTLKFLAVTKDMPENFVFTKTKKLCLISRKSKYNEYS